MPGRKILLVEDDDSDADLVMSAARRAGLDASWLRADDEASFLLGLDESPDAVVTDFNLPSFSALRVLELVRSMGSELPVLVVTGAIEDELAAECIKQGAADYLLKDRLARLRDALEGSIDRFHAAKQKRESERKLILSAKGRVVLNDMLLRSLSAELSAETMRSILEPLFAYEALPELRALRIDLPCLPGFTVGKPADADLPMKERVFDIVGEGLEVGRIVLFFSAGMEIDGETGLFLEEVAYVISGVLKRLHAEQSLRRSLAEQEELLREIHHRVKNNLASVQSLVYLEASKMEEGPARDALYGLEGKIRSMALVHEMLYSRGSFTGIDIDDYLHELKLHVAEESELGRESIALSTDCKGFRVPLEAAITLGILFNELFVHAFRLSVESGEVVSILIAAAPRG